MTTYSKIYEYLESTLNNRAHILPTDSGGWYLVGHGSHLSGISGPLKALILDQVPEGAQVLNMWLWLFNGGMRFTYSTPNGSLFTTDLIPGHFDEDFA